MHRHQHFDLLLHDNDELAEILSSSIAERTTIHEWPLSCVQRVRTQDGCRYIYKVQAPPSVEAEFYSKARSPLLVPVQVIGNTGHTTAMIMEEIDAPLVNETCPGENEAAAIASDITGQIAKTEGDLPFITDISTQDLWAAFIQRALDDVRALISEGAFHKVSLDLADSLSRWSMSASVLDVFTQPCGYVHADLKAENVLVTPDGYRVLDWQRPIRGPLTLDSVTLLISLGFDPVPFTSTGAVQLYHFLHIAWYAQAARIWLPQGKPWFDGLIADIGMKLGHLQQ